MCLDGRAVRLEGHIRAQRLGHGALAPFPRQTMHQVANLNAARDCTVARLLLTGCSSFGIKRDI